MPKMSNELADVLKQYHSNPQSAVWDCHGQLVAYHKACEEMARKAGITFDPPQVIEANSAAKTAVICVTGHRGEASDWSIGEASPANNKNAYPYAMAEKRAKDRVILKLLGLHGKVYSEEEAEDFKEGAPEPKRNPPGITKFRQELTEFYKELHACCDYEQYVCFVKSDDAQAFIKRARDEFPDDWHGDGGDIKGLKRDMEAIVENLKKEAA